MFVRIWVGIIPYKSNTAMTVTHLFRQGVLRLLPLCLLAGAIASCNRKDDSPATPAATQLSESRMYDHDTLRSQSTFTYNDKKQISEAKVRTYTHGILSDSFTTVYTYNDMGDLMKASSPVNVTQLGYDVNMRFTGCHTIWTDSATHPNITARYVYPSTSSDRPDSLILVKRQPGAAPYNLGAMKYNYGTDGTQTDIQANNGEASGTVKRSADNSRITGIAIKEGTRESYTALVYSDSLSNKDFMAPYLKIQHVAAAQCPYISPAELMHGKAAHILDAWQSPNINLVTPEPVYTQTPEAGKVRHEVVVGNKKFVYYTN